MGEDLKIMAQVFSVETGIQLGAVSVAGKTAEFFLVEKNLFSKVAETLKVVLNDAKEKKIMQSIETRSIDASLQNYAGEAALVMADEMKRLGRKKATEAYRNAAKGDFKKALFYDPEYKRAKENLIRLVMAIPMTI